MSALLTWMPFYVQDYLNDREVKKMPRVARSFYLDMLFHEWIGGPLPDDLYEVSGILDELPRSLKPHWPTIRQRFVIDSSGNLSHPKLEWLRNEALLKSEKAAKAAENRWKQNANALLPPTARAMPSESEKETHNNTVTEEDIAQFDFESVYQRYPRKLGKKRGLQLCASRVKSPEQYSALSQAVTNYARIVKAERTEAKFVKHFDTFMGCYEDYVDCEPSAPRHSAYGSTEPMAAVAVGGDQDL